MYISGFVNGVFEGKARASVVENSKIPSNITREYVDGLVMDYKAAIKSAIEHIVTSKEYGAIKFAIDNILDPMIDLFRESGNIMGSDSGRKMLTDVMVAEVCSHSLLAKSLSVKQFLGSQLILIQDAMKAASDKKYVSERESEGSLAINECRTAYHQFSAIVTRVEFSREIIKSVISIVTNGGK